MESFLPSEISRLVYGYLIEENCKAAAQLFLETSPFLKECIDYKKKGRKFSTTVLGLTLADILNLYTDAGCLVKNYVARKDSLNQKLSDFEKELGNILYIDHGNGRNISKTVFLQSFVPNKKSSHKNSEPLEKNEEDCENKNEKDYKKSNEYRKKKSQIEEASVSKNNPAANTDDLDLNMLQALLDNTALHERIAEIINKAIDSSGEIPKQMTHEKKIIATILQNTETDPLFNELLRDLVVPRTEDTTTPDDTDKENGDPSKNRQPKTGLYPNEAPFAEDTTSPDDTDEENGDPSENRERRTELYTNEDDEKTKKFLKETILVALEGFLAGFKKLQLEKVVP